MAEESVPGFDRDELQGIRGRAIEMVTVMAEAAGRFDNYARAYIALANAADRLDRLMAKDEGEEELPA